MFKVTGQVLFDTVPIEEQPRVPGVFCRDEIDGLQDPSDMILMVIPTMFNTSIQNAYSKIHYIGSNIVPTKYQK